MPGEIPKDAADGRDVRFSNGVNRRYTVVPREMSWSRRLDLVILASVSNFTIMPVQEVNK